MSSRILARNKRGLGFVVGGKVKKSPLPQDPRRLEWKWPYYVNNPVRYANYVARLHRNRGLSMKFPKGAFSRFASRYWDMRPEFLCRAACLASLKANHPFSPKFIKAQFSEVPQSVTQQQLF